MTKNQADVSQIFLVYMALIGDVDKTAIALDLEPKFVAKLADTEGWAEKIARVSMLSKGTNQGDYERAQNRALNFVQAHMLRRAIDSQLYLLANTKPEDVMKVIDSQGTERFSARIFVDLSTCMQRVHEMTYSALGDSVKERTADVPKDPTSQAGLHAGIIAALNKTGLPPETLPKTLADGATRLIEAAKATISIDVVEIPQTS